MNMINSLLLNSQRFIGVDLHFNFPPHHSKYSYMLDHRWTLNHNVKMKDTSASRKIYKKFYKCSS